MFSVEDMLIVIVVGCSILVVFFFVDGFEEMLVWLDLMVWGWMFELGIDGLE